MNRVAVVTDSIACLTKGLVDQYRIRVVPINVLFDGKVYRDWIDISPAEAYRMLEEAPELFTTSPPSPGELLDVYRELSGQAESILCIAVSSKLSTLYDVARLAKGLASQEHIGARIEVLDSQTAAAGQGFVVLAAARTAAEGKSLAEVINAAERVRERVNVFVLLETTRHAHRTGRIPKVAARIGSVLNIKPIFTISHGKVHFAAVTRTRNKGIERLLEMMRKKAGTNPVHVAVMHGSTPEEGERLKERVSSQFNCTEIWLTEFTPIMGYAAGPGVLALAFYTEASFRERGLSS
jgi:DegV family protein with EDD domain